MKKDALEVIHSVPIPLKWIGPIKMIGPEIEESVWVPMATYETPLWPSTERGARVCLKSGGIRAVILDDRMSRSVVFQTLGGIEAFQLVEDLKLQNHVLKEVASKTSRFVEFIEPHFQIIGNLVYMRLEMRTGDASGHNMVTKAADAILDWVLHTYPQAQYVSISGNFCTDKKVSAVNGILGRGKSVVADVIIPEKLCRSYLKTTPQQIVDLNIKKNLIGSILAGGVRSANAHFANALLAIYLATGQDAANIVEGSQGFTHAEVREDTLYFSVTIPHVIVGTVGNGKELSFVRDNLEKMGCLEAKRQKGANSRRLAAIIGAAVLCSELSLLAAQTNRGELVRTHMALER